MINVKYGNQNLKLNINSTDILSPDFNENITKTQIVKKIKIGLKNLDDKPSVFILPDYTRPAHIDKLFPIIIKEIKKYVSKNNITILIAAGLHRLKEINVIRKEYKISEEYKIVQNQCHRDEDYFYTGIKVKNKKIKILKQINTAEQIIILGVIEPHYLAGMSGSVKAILPGCADFNSIVGFHSLCLDKIQNSKFSPLVRPGNINNPMRKTLDELVQKLEKKIVSIDVISAEKNIYDVRAGIYPGTYIKTVKQTQKIFGKRTNNEKYEAAVVSCGGYPFDVNLYQAHKSLINNYKILLQCDEVYFFAECIEGYGPKKFEEALFLDNTIVFEKMLNNFNNAYHTAYSLKLLNKKIKIFFVSDLFKNENHQKEFNILDLKKAKKILCNKNDVLFIPNGHLVYTI